VDQFDRTVTPQERNIAGYSSLAVGAFIIAISAGLVPQALAGEHAPVWVIFAAGSVFVLAGVNIVLRERLPVLATELLANVLWTLLAAIAAWAAWGDDQGEIHGSGITLAWLFNFDGQAMGRFVFAASAILVATIAAACWWRSFAKLGWRMRAGIFLALALAAGTLAIVIPAEPFWPDVHDDHERLARYALLSGEQGWYQRKKSASASWYHPYWRNYEHWIQAARSRLAAIRSAPEGAKVHTIPISAKSPVIDGNLGADEWHGALRITLEPQWRGCSVLLQSDGRHLFLAADVTDNASETPYDRLDFRFHLALSPWLEDESAVIHSDGKVQTLRTLRLRGESGKSEWRTDAHIFEQVHGATAVQGHRVYELELDLVEAGIKVGAPFAARLEIQGESSLAQKKPFRSRPKFAWTGTVSSPLWLRIGG